MLFRWTYIWKTRWIVWNSMVWWTADSLSVIVADEPVNRRSNVFTNILQPIHHLAGMELVQLEIHHR